MYTDNDYNEADKNPNDKSSFTCIELYAKFKGWQACTIHQALKDFKELDPDKQNEFCEILIQMLFHISDLFHMDDFIQAKNKPINTEINQNKCIHPDCECLDYCEALDPFSPTPERS